MALDLGPFHLSPVLLLISVLIGLGVPFLAAYLPLWQGTHITVHEAMSGYGTSSGGSRGKLAPRLTWVPQTLWLSLRTIFRKRGRAIRTLAALTLSATAFLSIQTTTYAFNTGLDQITSIYSFDASVGINPQSYAKVRAQLLNLPNVASVERWQGQLMQTPKGNVVLTGFESNTQLYTHHMLTGRWLNSTDERALVITDILAQRAHLKVGDTLNITSSTGTATWHVIGTLHDINDASQGLLGEAITTVDQFDSFTGFPNQFAYQLIIGARDRSPAAVDRLANQIDQTLSLAGMAPTVTTIQQLASQTRSQFQLIDALFYAVAMIIALVGILGLFNTLTSSILERRRELGILRAIGATRWRISSMAWFEGSFLSLLAWLVAALLGIPCAYGFVQLVGAVLLPIPFVFSPVAMIMMLVFVILLATLASIGPALGAVRMRIAETLRYE
jgi:putative ABC transport system permease protein